jgi:hypothetical protein
MFIWRTQNEDKAHKVSNARHDTPSSRTSPQVAGIGNEVARRGVGLPKVRNERRAEHGARVVEVLEEVDARERVGTLTALG